VDPLLANPLFVVGAHRIDQLPADEGAEIAFAGRSNVGKSSAINALFGRRSLARISRTPGRTQQLNVFALDDGHRVVDMPGYGFAQVPMSVRRHWDALLERYLRTRRSLRGLILIMDVRHPLTEFDRQMLGWCVAAGMPVHALLTKSDKLGRGAAGNALQKVQRDLEREYHGVSVQLFSAQSRLGVEDARQVLLAMLGREQGRH
jgi:GTP-binding protein